MKKRTRNEDKTKDALNALTDTQMVELAVAVREAWRQEVAAGTLKLDPKLIRAVRAYDKTLQELQQLTGA